MKKILILAVVAVCCRGEIFSRSNFADAILTAVDSDPAIAAMVARNQSAYNSAKAENSLQGPELEFEYLWSTVKTERDKWNVGITQEFSAPAVYKARSRYTEAERGSADASLAVMRLEKALVIKQALVDLINANRRLNLYKEIRSNIDRINELTQRAYDTGNSTILDVKKLQLAILENEDRIGACRTDIEQQLASLASMNVSVDDFTPGMLDQFPIMEIKEPDYSPLKAEISARQQAAEAQARLSGSASWPSLGVGYRHAFEDGIHFNGLAVSLTLPQWGRSRRQRAAQLEAEAVTFDSRAAELTFESENQALMRQATINANNLEKYRNLTSDNSYLQLLEKAFDGGQLTVIDYLSEINLFADARLNYLDLEYRQTLTLVRLGKYNSEDF